MSTCCTRPIFWAIRTLSRWRTTIATVVEQALRLKKIGNRIVTLLGGREIHPISATVGGFYKAPAKSQLQALADDLQWALDTSLATVKLVAGFEFPDFEQDYEFVALVHPERISVERRPAGFKSRFEHRCGGV